MRWPIVHTLWKKEMLEMLRDRRTILIMVLLPLVLYPVIGIITSQAQSAHVQKLQASRLRVGLVGAALPAPLMQKLLRNNELEHIPPYAPWKERLAQKQLHAILDTSYPSIPSTQPVSTPSTAQPKHPRPPTNIAPPSASLPKHPETAPPAASLPASTKAALLLSPRSPSTSLPSMRLTAPPPYTIRVIYLSTWDASRTASRRIEDILREFHREALQKRLQDFRIAPAFVQVFTVKTQDTASAQARGRDLLGTMLPLLLIIMTIVGALYPAVDLTAGEKERGTLETLLTAPITSIEIVTGKYLTIFCISLATGLLNMFSLWLTFSQGLRMLASNRKLAIDMTLNFQHYLALIGFLALIAALSSAVMLSMASFARSFKEGQNYTTPAYLLCFMPAFLATLPGAKPSLTSAMIPFVNVAYAIKGTIKGDLSLDYALLTVFSMLVVTVAFLRLSAMIFQNEQVLFREGDISWRGLFSQNTAHPQPLPNISDTFFLLSLQFALFFYVGLSLQQKNIALGTAITLWGIFLLPAVLWARTRHLDIKATFRLQPLPLRQIPPILLIVLGGLPLVLIITYYTSMWLFPDWLEFARKMNESLSLKSFGISTPVFFLILALSPGICEEAVFRGFALSSFHKRLSPQTAIALSAFLFAAFHLSLYRLLPTFLLGLVFGWLCWRTGSLYASVLAHTLHNALSLAIGLFFAKTAIARSLDQQPAVWWLPLGLILFVTGIVWLHRIAPPPRSAKTPLSDPRT
ncbi:ABC transporter permease subunit [Myxococcota bacterium]|nr:ABC transporter permease subunit [Myxococcota bacterium]